LKPEGRSLDIAVVGLGQGGGNLASEFFRRGYRAIAINTAQTDLGALEPGGVFPALPAERRIYIGLDGYDGAGADPVYGRQCIADNRERIRSAILKHAGEADVVLIAAGLGGGTGSALADLIKIFKDDDLPLVALATLPTEGESGIHKVNAVRAINELVDAEILGWILIDNARIAALNPDVSIVDYYAHINGQIASPIDALNRLNDRSNLKPIRSFDGEDLRKLLLSGGVLNYGVVELPTITAEEVVGAVKDCIEASELMPSGFAMPRLSYIGVVIEATEAVLAQTSISVFEEIDEELKKETEGAAVYHGIYRSSTEQPTTMRLIAATQSLPHRIRQVLADAKREGMVLGEKIREELPTLELGEIESFELFRTGGRTRPSEKPRRAESRSDASDEGAPYSSFVPSTDDDVHRKDLQVPDVPRDPRMVKRRPNRARDGAPPPSAQAIPSSPRQLGSRPSAIGVKATAAVRDVVEGDSDNGAPPEVSTEEVNVIAELARLGDQKVKAEDVSNRRQDNGAPKAAAKKRVPPSPPETGEVPNPEMYDKLVNDYKQTKQPRVREEVVRRLEEDSISEHTVVRYYAVEAMSKLGREVFGTALLAATEDENEAVRAIAVEALRR
jgi:cell division GTPase FtsZ